MQEQHGVNKVEADYFIMGDTFPHTPYLISTSLLVVFNEALVVFFLTWF